MLKGLNCSQGIKIIINIYINPHIHSHAYNIHCQFRNFKTANMILVYVEILEQSRKLIQQDPHKLWVPR